MKINYKIQNMQLAGLLHDHRYVYSIEVIYIAQHAFEINAMVA